MSKVKDWLLSKQWPGYSGCKTDYLPSKQEREKLGSATRVMKDWLLSLLKKEKIDGRVTVTCQHANKEQPLKY